MTTAPVGEYDVVITARDLAGNESRETARILIPAPGITPTPLPTRTPLPTLTTVPQSSFIIPNSSLILPTATLRVEPPGRASRGPVETRAAVVSAFQSSTRLAPITTYQSTNPSAATSSSAPLFGAAAITAIVAATGLVLAAKRRREEEEARQAAEAQAEAARRNAAEETQKLQNYLQSKAALEAMLQNPALSETEKARIREEAKTKGLASAFTLAHTTARGLDDVSTGSTRRLDPTSAARQQAYQDYRAGERDAEAIAAEYQTRKAVQDYRQGERAEYVTPSQPIPWWQRAWNAVTGTLSLPKTDSSKLAVPVKDEPPWWEKLIEKGKGIVQSVTQQTIATKQWFTGEDVGYTGSGWGHGPRQWIARQLGLDDRVGNVFTLVSRSLLQYDKVSLDGSLLQKIQNDPAMQEMEQLLINKANGNTKYGEEAFSFESQGTLEFGGKRAPGDMWEQLKHPLSGLRGSIIEHVQRHGLFQTVEDLINPKKDVIRLNYADTWKVGFNELTWATRHATIKAQVQVSEQGEIHIEYHLQDELDLEPSSGRSDAYNAITRILGKLYHDILGGNNQMQVEAQWSSDR